MLIVLVCFNLILAYSFVVIFLTLSTTSISTESQIYPSTTLLEDVGGLAVEHELMEEHEDYLVFAPNSSLGEQIKGAYMPSWALLSMTAVEERVRTRNNKTINKN